MGQVNVEFDEDTIRSLDRIAAKQSIRRPELLRRTVRELIDADGQGREPFAAVVQEVTAEDVTRLAHEHRQLAMDLDRVLRANDKREAQLVTALAEIAALKVAYERDVAAARERGLREAEDASKARLAPLQAELAEHRAETARIVAEHPRLRQLEEGQRRLMQAIRVQQPPVRFEFGAVTLPVWWPLATLGTTILLGFGLLLALATALPNRLVAVPMADHMLDGRAFCTLVDRRMGDGACARLIRPDQPATQLATKPRAKR